MLGFFQISASIIVSASAKRVHTNTDKRKYKDKIAHFFLRLRSNYSRSLCRFSCACNGLLCSHCLYELLCVPLRFSVFVWTLILAQFSQCLYGLVLALASLSVCIHCCICHLRMRFSVFLLLCLRLRFPMLVWILEAVLTLASL